MSAMPLYEAFANWRAACIGVDVVHRYRAGNMAFDADTAVLDRSIARHAERAERLVTAQSRR
jgi:hypothetical protein